MSKTSKLILTALASVFLAGSAAFLASQNFDNAIEAKATTVSDLAGLQAALVGADENTVIYVDTSIDINSSISIDGNGATIRVETPYITASGAFDSNPTDLESIFHISGSSVTAELSNMTLMNGKSGSYSFAGAIEVTNNATLKTNNVTITHSNRGIDLSNSKAILKNTNIVRNAATAAGGIMCDNSILVMDGCSLSENRSLGNGGGGGAIEVRYDSVLYANNTVIVNNSSSEIGGAVNVKESEIYLMNCTIAGNVTTASPQCGGGIGLNTDDDCYVVNSLVCDNYRFYSYNNTFVSSDIGFYTSSRTGKLRLIGSRYTGEPAYNTNQTYGDVFEAIDSSIIDSETLADNYRNDSVLIRYGRTASFNHPVSVAKGGNKAALYVPVLASGDATTGITPTYFNYEDLTNVKMGIHDGVSIVAIGSLNAPSTTDLVSTYYEGGSRVSSIIGASAPGSDASPRYMVRMEGNPRTDVTGITIYGDSYLEGSDIPISASAANFDHWIIDRDGSETNVSSASYTITNITSNVYVTPIYLHTVSFATNEGTGTGPADEYVLTGDSLTLPDCTFTAPDDHMVFDRWTKWSDEYYMYIGVSNPYTVLDDVTLYAEFEYESHIISFNRNGGTGLMNSISRSYGSSYTLPQPGDSAFKFTAPANHHFAGWAYASNGEVIDTPSITITEDITLYAIWEINSYTISFNGNGGTGSMSDIVMTHGSSLDEAECEFTAPAHYHFAGWSTSSSVDDMVDEWPMVITSDVTLYALWAQDTYQIQLHRNGGSNTADPIVKAYGEFLSQPENPFTAPEHKVFAGWSLTFDGSVIDEWPLEITGPLTLYAIWAVESHTITFNGNGAEGSMTQIHRDYGFSYILPACEYTAPANKHFVGWSYTSEGGVIPTSSIFVGGDITLYAIWAYDTHTVSFNSNSGSGSLDSISVTHGNSMSLPTCPFTAPEHKHFVGWAYSENGTVISTSSIVVENDLTLYAIWANDTNKVTILSGEGSGSTIILDKEYGATFALPTCEFTAPSGKEFAGWKVNDDETLRAPGYEITVNDATTIIAIYKVIPVNLVSIALSGTYQTSYEVGDVFSTEGLIVTATYSNGSSSRIYNFSVTGYNMSTEGTQTVTVTYIEGDITKTATYQITVTAAETTPDVIDNQPDTNTNQPDASKKGVSNGVLIVLIIIPIFLLLVIVALIIYFKIIEPKRKNKQE